ncbi:hypothetical protein OAD57_00600 [Porticoccaceae bacterium]|nr:hypothetical protein [Porticoccaceae bacterium]
MKISVEKLVANRANVQKSTGPLTSEGKLRSAKNSAKHGLSAAPISASNTSSDSPPVNVQLTPEFQFYVQELINSGYSDTQSQALADALFSSRQVIQAKHATYTDRLNDDRLANISVEAVAEFVREFERPGSGVTKAERRAVVAILVKEVAKDNNLPGLLYEKFEAHRKLMRYEQRAFNQLRKKSRVKK